MTNLKTWLDAAEDAYVAHIAQPQVTAALKFLTATDMAGASMALAFRATWKINWLRNAAEAEQAQ